MAIVAWILTGFHKIAKARLPCLLTILVGVAVERQVSYFEKGLGYTGLVFWSRSLVLIVTFWHLRQASSMYVDLEKRNHKLISKVVDECVLNTPLWFKKYRDTQTTGSLIRHHRFAQISVHQ